MTILKVDIWYCIGAAWELVSADSDTNTVTNADTNAGTNTDTNMDTNIDANTNTDTNKGTDILCFIGPPSSSLGIGISCFQRFSSKSLEAETNQS